MNCRFYNQFFPKCSDCNDCNDKKYIPLIRKNKFVQSKIFFLSYKEMLKYVVTSLHLAQNVYSCGFICNDRRVTMSFKSLLTMQISAVSLGL